MKNRLRKIIFKYSSGYSCEYYKNSNGHHHGPYIRFYSNGQKDWEGSYILNRYIGVWKGYEIDGRRIWRIDTWKNYARNGVKILFDYEKK